MKQQELKDRVYVLSNDAAPLSKFIASKDNRRSRLLYKDPKTGRQRSMRYSRNHESPFIDEQDDNAIIEPIVFREGILSVQSSNLSLQAFLAIHPGNEANGGGIFYEADPEKQAKERMAELDLRTDAIIAAKQLDFNTLLGLARTFLSGNVDKMSTSEIKYDMLRYAEAHPEQFLNAIGDPDMELNNYAARAFQDKLVTFRSGKDIHYNLPDNKKKLCTVPLGMNEVDALSAYLHSDDGIDFYKILSNMFED